MFLDLTTERIERERADDHPIPVVHRRKIVHRERIANGAVEVDDLSRNDRYVVLTIPRADVPSSGTATELLELRGAQRECPAHSASIRSEALIDNRRTLDAPVLLRSPFMNEVRSPHSQLPK